jgi:hypothetical protein
MDRSDPYLLLLRRELTRAQARLRRCERERDAMRAALDALRAQKSHLGVAKRRKKNESVSK